MKEVTKGILKKVHFNKEVDQYLFQAPIEAHESESGSASDSSDKSESNSDNSDISSAHSCGSDPEDMDSGEFFDYIQKQTQIAERERKFVMKKLKAKSRVGSIFFDKVDRVIAAVQRDHGKYDYLVEWAWNSVDKLKPTTSIVKGSHFVFAKPLLFRRCLEAQYVEKCLNTGGP